MFTIQYMAANGAQKMQSFDSGSRHRLARHLANFEHPIQAVYEQASPITKAMQAMLRQCNAHELSRNAREFAWSSVTSPA